MQSMLAVIDRFSLAHDPVFHRLQQRLGWLGERANSAKRRAVLLVGLAWGVPLLLTLFDGRAWGAAETSPFLLDWIAWAQYAVGIGVLTMMVRVVDGQLRRHLRQFVRAPLLAPAAMIPAAAAVERALARAQSPYAAAVCAVLACVASVAGGWLLQLRTRDTWMLVETTAEPTLSIAGWWCILISGPIFWFLLLRWLWRHAAWALLLHDLARLELRLVVSHPDGVGGVGFVGQYPNAFATLVFAMTALLAAVIARGFQADVLTLAVYGQIMAGWLTLMISLFALPLAAFAWPLRRLKQETLLAASARATRHFRAAERATLGGNVVAAADASETTIAEVANPQAHYTAALKLGMLPFDRTAIVPLGAAALLPLVAAGATRLPFQELWTIARKLLLL
ncbi:MAG: hypothetical protein EA356_10735 [Geminicoccaceae bacterium]|nr:MAG: hypothetical protein EA356_10735 [Geminicoccaceae bacterium]